eukprot:scaffold1036_cov169-Ochromonas_danica.AAC.36
MKWVATWVAKWVVNGLGLVGLGHQEVLGWIKGCSSLTWPHPGKGSEFNQNNCLLLALGCCEALTGSVLD